MDVTTTLEIKNTSMKSSSWWNHLIGGGVAGAISRTCTAPVDRIKIYLQIQTQKTGVIETVRHLVKEGGVLIYDESKRFLRGHEPRSLTVGERFLSGALAGNVSQMFFYPMDVLKTRLALVTKEEYMGVKNMIRDMLVKEGIKSFYRGYNAFAVGITLYCGIDLTVYETLKQNYLWYMEEESTLNPLIILGCCTLSSSVGQLATYPLAMLSTRHMATVIHKGDEVLKKRFFEKNMLRLLWQISRNEGVSGLYRGLIPNFMKSIPAVGITYIVYEYTINLLGYSMT
ncbi:calcium-binding mitochondrial carrier protein SCaMC-1-like isoform X2 [Ceratitis capitata]|uniref:calcium-binding mitochondrial carrier protein SCaMC-1-like isoform X2 n=1 Tax=Ceratitis capitata TaxID=7213 RepID=UPI000A10A32F|nr:calcium-binding mitochondrial carrier protein SCaMC-1-like isoform X2 [Ceratitis capitata]